MPLRRRRLSASGETAASPRESERGRRTPGGDTKTDRDASPCCHARPDRDSTTNCRTQPRSASTAQPLPRRALHEVRHGGPGTRQSIEAPGMSDRRVADRVAATAPPWRGVQTVWQGPTPIPAPPQSTSAHRVPSDSPSQTCCRSRGCPGSQIDLSDCAI